MPGPAVTPLLIRFGALGDMVLNTPLLRALAQRHGAPCAVACIGSWVPSLYRGLPFVGEIRTIASRGAPYILCPDQWRLVAFMRTFRGHPTYLFDSDQKSQWLADRAGLILSGNLRTLEQLPNQHQVLVQARIAGFANRNSFAPGFDPGAELAVSAEELAECQSWLTGRIGAHGTLVLLHMGNKKTASRRRRSGNIKDWPAEHWLEVIRGIRADLPEAHILLTGSVFESRVTKPVAQSCGNPRVVSVAGETSLRRLFALMRLAHSAVSVDTGPAHAAAALGCPLVVLFGQTDPRVNRPMSQRSPVHVVTGPPGASEPDGEAGWRANHDMSGISPGAVIAAWRRVAGSSAFQINAPTA